MTFKQLIESRITISQAIGLLGLDVSFSADDLKKAYRAKSREAHPDLGGSTEQMQKINTAYELLKSKDSINVPGNRGSRTNWDEIHKEYKELCKNLNRIMGDSFDKKAYTDYFKEVFGQPFKITNFKFIGEDYYKGPSKDQYGSPSFAGIGFTIESKDGNIVVDFRADVYLSSVKGDKGLGSGTVPSVPVSITSTGFFSGRKFKLFNKSWGNEQIESFKFNDVELFFPRNKLEKHLEKKARTKATKKDFISAVTKILKGKSLDGNDTFAVPTKNSDDIFLIVSRGTFMRKGYYTFNISEKKGYRYIPTDSSVNQYHTFYETPELLDFVLSLKDKSARQIETLIKKEILKIDKSK
jgi:curved DNA-binding protein CbpA